MSDDQAISPKRVVILGGGPAGVAAAFWLTAPEQQGRYQVTLYAQGWRLGGKCASGRDATRDNLIEEHGLHMLLGCYQNAFATIRACYEAWAPAATSPIKTWTDAFLPVRHVTLEETDGPGGAWATWDFAGLPSLPGEPGDPAAFAAMLAKLDEKPAGGAREQILRLCDWLQYSVHIGDLVPLGDDAVDALGTAARHGPIHIDKAGLLKRITEANVQLRNAQTKDPKRAEPLRQSSAAQSATASENDRLLDLANLGISAGMGYLEDILFGGDDEAAYDALDAKDFRGWLSGHGASPETLASAPVRALYDLAFAFPNGLAGDINDGSMAAGATLRFAMELAFGYRNAPLWKMAAGMGDVVFAPFYQVLAARNSANFQFFSRVTNLRASAGAIGEIDLSIQAVTNNGGAYNPLVFVHGLACWPNQPDWSQLQNGPAIKGQDFESTSCTTSVGTLTLKAGQDYDIAILAIPPAAIDFMQPSFVQGNPAWTAALAASQSVATQSLQLWLQPTLKALGWNLGTTVMTAFAEPYDSWADMTHLLPAELWSFSTAPQTLGYFCGCLAIPPGTSNDPGAMLNLAVSDADDWMATSLPVLWPNFSVAQIVTRYDRANYDVSELYVQTPAGANVGSRFSSGAVAGFANLYVVGDWTKTRFCGGCFESAIESGMLASRAISGIPAQIKTS